jgi:hypothetical protein
MSRIVVSQRVSLDGVIEDRRFKLDEIMDAEGIAIPICQPVRG